MKLNQLLRSGLLAIFVSFTSLQLKAGWILTGRFINQEGKTIMQRFFIQDFNVKFEQYNMIYTLNLNTSSIILVDPINLVYYKGTINSYILGLKKMKTRQLDKLISEIPEGQKEACRKAYSPEIDLIGQPIIPVRDSVFITKTDDSLKVFGKATQKFQVNINTRKAEEIWISPVLNISSQFSWEKYLYFLSVVEPGNPTLGYMTSAKYLALLARGFPVRRILVVEGFRNEFQVNRMEEKKIPDYEFYTPSSCKELTFEQWVDRNKNKEPEYDDYE